jgi:hypothetical protein
MVLTLAFGAMLALPASVGVGISGFPACLPVPAQPGHSYVLHVSVVNTGSGGESISIQTGPPVNGLKGIAVPPQWVSFGYPKLLGIIGQGSVSLSPGQQASVPVTVSVPAGAKPGLYGANLVAGAMSAPSPGGGGQAVLGAAAEDDLEFAVAPGKAPSCDLYPAVTPGPKVPAPDYSPAPAASSAPGRGYALAAVGAVLWLAWRWRRRRSRR